jgi:hypothetical protein
MQTAPIDEAVGVHRNRSPWPTSSPVRDRLVVYAQLSGWMTFTVVTFGLAVRVSDVVAGLVFG